MKKALFIIIPILSLAIISVLFFTLFSFGVFYSHDSAVEYLSQFPKKTNIAVTDLKQSFYYNDTTTDVKGKINKENLNIYYITKNYVYIGYDENGKHCIYKCDHNLEYMEKIHEFVGDDKLFCKFLDEDLFIYGSDEKYYTYRISTKEITNCEKSYQNEYAFSNNRYSVFETPNFNPFDYGMSSFRIVDNITGEEKKIKKKDFYSVEQANYLHKKCMLHFSSYSAVGDKVYLFGGAKECIIIFEYDFESNSVSFYSWFDFFDLHDGIATFYFFEN